MRHRRQPGRQTRNYGTPRPRCSRASPSARASQTITLHLRRRRARPWSAAPPTPSRRPRPRASTWPSRSTPRPLRSARSAGCTVTFIGAGTCVIDANQAGSTQLQCRVAGAAELRRRQGQPDDQLHLDGAGGRGRRGDLHGHRERDARAIAGDLHHRRLGQFGLFDLRQQVQLHRRGHLRHRRQPGRQQQLQCRAAGAAELSPSAWAARRSPSPRRRRARRASPGGDLHCHGVGDVAGYTVDASRIDGSAKLGLLDLRSAR